MPDSFVIGETDFGVDRSTLKFEFPLRPDGLANIHIEVGGDEAVFDRVSESEDWSWALYAPFFFIRRYPVPPEDANLSHPIELPDRDETFEMHLYMMEYCEVSSVVIRRVGDGVSIAGHVDLWGKDLPFYIHLEDGSRV